MPTMGISRSRVRTWRRLVALLIVVVLAYHALPYDNHCRLAVRLLTHVPRQRPLTDDQLLSRAPPYPVNLAEDVSLIIKSGFGTKDRLPGSLQLLDEDGPHFSSIMLVGDFDTKHGQHYNCNGVDVPVHDVIRMTIERAPVAQAAKLPPKLGKYARLQEAIANDDEDLARSLSQEFGWELDAMKVLFSPQKPGAPILCMGLLRLPL